MQRSTSISNIQEKKEKYKHKNKEEESINRFHIVIFIMNVHQRDFQVVNTYNSLLIGHRNQKSHSLTQDLYFL